MLGLFKKKQHPIIDESIPLANAHFVVVDTELTGLDEKRDSIVSIGAVRMNNGAIDIGGAFYRVVSPRTEMKADSVVIHEIMPSEVQSEPEIGAVLGDFLEFCGSRPMIGHFVSIDLSFLDREIKRAGRGGFTPAAIDTFSLYEWLRKREVGRECFVTPLAGYRLYDIVRCFGIPVNSAHNALMDAFMTAQLLQRFLPLLAEAGVKNLGDLLRIGAPFKGGDHFGQTGEISNF
jgi:DNA polymerase-3 subunit epsilon